MANRVVEILYSLKDKFTGQVRKITAGYKQLGDEADKAGDRLERAHKRANDSIGALGRKIALVGRNIVTGFGTAAASIAAVAIPAKNAAEEFDKLAKQADKIGVSTDALQELRFAGQRTGVAINAVDVAIQRFSRRLGEAGQGTGVLKKEFDRLGIAVRDSQGNLRTTEDVLRDYADAIASTQSPQEQLRLAFAAFDTEGAALVNTLRNGSNGLDQFAQAARDAGQVVEERLLRSAEEINDRFDELSDTLSFRFKTALVEMAGAASRFFARFDIGGDKVRNLEVQLQALIDKRDRLERRGDPLSLIQADEVNAEIFRVTAQLDDLRIKADQAGDALQDIPTSGVARIRQQLEAATGAAANLYGETQKLFQEKPKDPLDGLDSTAGKVSRAYSLVGDALSSVRVDPDSEEAAQNIEAAAAAINQLKAAGDVTDDTINRLKNTLATAFDQQLDDQSLKIIPSIDDNGIPSFTNEATQKLQAAMQEQQIIVPVGADTSAAEQALDALEQKAVAIAASLRARSDRLANDLAAWELEVEQRGDK